NFTATECQNLCGELAHFAVAQDDNAVSWFDMYLFEDFKVGSEWFDEDGFFVTHTIRDDMQILQGQGEVFGKGSVAVDDAECGAVGAVGGHIVSARGTIGTMTGGVDFANNPLAFEVSILFLGCVAMHVFNDANK